MPAGKATTPAAGRRCCWRCSAAWPSDNRSLTHPQNSAPQLGRRRGRQPALARDLLGHVGGVLFGLRADLLIALLVLAACAFETAHRARDLLEHLDGAG